MFVVLVLKIHRNKLTITIVEQPEKGGNIEF